MSNLLKLINTNAGLTGLEVMAIEAVVLALGLMAGTLVGAAAIGRVRLFGRVGGEVRTRVWARVWARIPWRVLRRSRGQHRMRAGRVPWRSVGAS